MSTNTPATTPTTAAPVASPQIIVYGHSWIFYWWPVWLTGYIMALLTWLNPVDVDLGGSHVLFSSRATLGVIFVMVVLMTILITTTHMRGLVSLVVVLVAAFTTLLLAYFELWGPILHWFGHQTIFMDLGFYLFFSTGLLLMWLLVVLFFDHLSFWRIRAGQITHEYILGAVENSYDTDSMVFTKQQSDFFLNWVLGFGSGDLQMQMMGGRGAQVKVSNVLFLNSRMARIQQLIATKPDVPQ